MIKRIEKPFAQWCKEVIESNNYVFCDTETTGTKRWDQIIELAIIDTAGTVLYDKLIKPTCEMNPGAFEAHHITEAMLAPARSFAQEWPDIERAIAGRAIITYNAEFDARMMQQSGFAQKIILKDIDYYCLMKEYAQFWNAPSKQGVWLGSQKLSGNAPFQKLQEACRQQGIEFEQNHRALGDTLAALSIIKRIADLGADAPTFTTRKSDPWDCPEDEQNDWILSSIELRRMPSRGFTCSGCLPISQ